MEEMSDRILCHGKQYEINTTTRHMYRHEKNRQLEEEGAEDDEEAETVNTTPAVARQPTERDLPSTVKRLQHRRGDNAGGSGRFELGDRKRSTEGRERSTGEHTSTRTRRSQPIRVRKTDTR